ncbi:Two-component response regulator ARR1 [Linum perenne]
MEKTTPVPNVDDDRLPTTKNKSTPADEYTDDSLPSDFPIGLKVLLIDDNPTCLLILRQMLHRCMFRVTACRRSKDAVAMLREDKFRFDIVISDVHMPEIDGFKILEIAAQEMDLPVVLTSSDDDQRLVMESVLREASDYLVKPVSMNSLKIIWQHVVRKRRSNGRKDSTNFRLLPSQSLTQPVTKTSSNISPVEQSENCTVDNQNNGAAEISSTPSLKKSNDDEENDSSEGAAAATTTKGKKRMIWTDDLHEKFLRAINYLCPSNVVPTKILECMQKMGVEGITRENVASHLQKYRMQLRKQEEHEHESLLLRPSSSIDIDRRFHPPLMVGSCSGTSIPVDHHHHLINNNNSQLHQKKNNNNSQLYESGCVVFTQPNVESTGHEYPVPIDVKTTHELYGTLNSRHHHVVCDPYFNLQDQFHQNTTNDSFGSNGDDHDENTWQY